MTVSAAQVLDRASLRALAGLRGRRWRCFGGEDLSEPMTDVEVSLTTEGHGITVGAPIDYLEFTGEEDTYSCLVAEPGAVALEAASAAGYVYYLFRGQEVRDVLVVRETVRASSAAEEAWTYRADIAVVVQLRSGFVAVEKVSHHSELLAVRTARSIDGLHLREPTGTWPGALGLRHDVAREAVPVAALLEP